MRLKVNDQVAVIAGKDRGYKGKITKVFPKLGTVVVEGANKYKRHIKKQGNQPGQIVEIERPLAQSKVQLISPHTGKVTRIRVERAKTGEAMRICVKSGKPLDK
jgi:large subunit ribosomal protein L24